MTIKLYTLISVGPYPSTLIVGTGAPTKEKEKKRTDFARGVSHLTCLLPWNNLIEVPGVIFLHAGSRT